MRNTLIALCLFTLAASAQTSNVQTVKAWKRTHVIGIPGGGLLDPTGTIADGQRSAAAAAMIAESSNIVAAAGQGLTNALERLWDAADHTNDFTGRLYLAADMDDDPDYENIEAYVVAESVDADGLIHYYTHYTRMLETAPKTMWAFEPAAGVTYWAPGSIDTNAPLTNILGYACYDITVERPQQVGNIILRTNKFLKWGTPETPLDISDAGLEIISGGETNRPFTGSVTTTNFPHEITEVYLSGFLHHITTKKAEPVTLTFEYVSTYPATITIGGTGYGQPADPSKALVDAGDGVFVPWTSNTITLKGKRIRFRGDWRNASGNLRELFNGTFGGGHNVTMSGGFDVDGVPADYMFYYTFNGCSKLTGSIPVGLFGNISGAPASFMFYATFSRCSNLSGPIPSGLFGNISGAPAFFMFYYTFYNCGNLTGPIPSGLFGDISGAPADWMFAGTFNGCSKLTGSIPVGLFGDISGAPASFMFYYTFSGCSKLTGESALMPDGVTHLYEQFPTASGTQCENCYLGAAGLDDYATIPAAWK